MAYDSIMSERALREIYLMPFMLAQKLAQPWAMMTASVYLLLLWGLCLLFAFYLDITVSTEPTFRKITSY